MCIFNYKLSYEQPVSSCVSIALQIAQIEIANWKYTKWKHVNFAQTPIYSKNVFTVTWGGF